MGKTTKYSVSYNGKYPVACMGRLVIYKDGKEIYNKDFCCTSTGAVLFDSTWNSTVVPGELIWNDADKFDKEIQEAVAEKLSEVNICCGGCI